MQSHGRHLLDVATKTNADASLLSGNIGMDTIRQSILGYNQGRNLLQDGNVKVGTSRGCSASTTAEADHDGRSAPLAQPGHHPAGLHCCSVIKSWPLQAAAAASIAGGNINPTTVRQAILGFNSGRNLLQSVKVCIAPDVGNIPVNCMYCQL